MDQSLLFRESNLDKIKENKKERIRKGREEGRKEIRKKFLGFKCHFELKKL